MSDKNFSWGILGLIIGVIAPVIAIVALAFAGLADPVTVSALITVTISSITGLSGIMNPNRKFNGDDQLAKDLTDVKKMLQ